jgi:hypothetical protein
MININAGVDHRNAHAFAGILIAVDQRPGWNRIDQRDGAVKQQSVILGGPHRAHAGDPGGFGNLSAVHMPEQGVQDHIHFTLLTESKIAKTPGNGYASVGETGALQLNFGIVHAESTMCNQQSRLLAFVELGQRLSVEPDDHGDRTFVRLRYLAGGHLFTRREGNTLAVLALSCQVHTKKRAHKKNNEKRMTTHFHTDAFLAGDFR